MRQQSVIVGGITYYEHQKSISQREREHQNGGKVSPPVFACPGGNQLTEKQIIDWSLMKGRCATS